MELRNIAEIKEWEIRKISDVVFYQEGPGVRRTQYTENGVKLLNVGNIQECKIDLGLTDRYISEQEAHGRYEHFLVDEGDLIIACSGIQVSYFHEKIAFAEKEHLPLCMNTSTMRFKSLNSDELNLRYFSCFLKTNYFKKQLGRLITGSAQLNFGPSHIEQIDIIVPPISAQKQIVEVLDQAQKLIDSRKEQIRLLDDLIESIFYEMFGDPVKNEKGWEVKKFEDFSNVRSSKRVYISECVDEGVPFYRGAEISKLSLGKTFTPELYITEGHYNDLKEHTGVPKKGDLLLPSICAGGEVWVVDTKDPFYFKDGRVLWVELMTNSIASIYLQYSFSRMLINNFYSIASGSTFPEMKIFILKDFQIPVPPLPLQNQCAEKVEAIESQKRLLQESLSLLDDNYNNLMQRAFKGELF